MERSTEEFRKLFGKCPIFGVHFSEPLDIRALMEQDKASWDEQSLRT